jgi:cytochrome c-type biogenesis protein CcsB
MKKIKDILFSMELTGILLMMFAISIGYATFIENDFGTTVAKSRIYNATWFELLLLLLAINMVGSIFTHKMYVKKKLTILLFHISFLVILAGAAITRYISYEGMMRIREGETSNSIISDKTYIQVWADNGTINYYHDKKVMPMPRSAGTYHHEFTIGNQAVKIKVLNYYTNAGETVIEGEGDRLLWLVISQKNSGRQDFYLKQGDVKNIGTSVITFNAEPLINAINIITTDTGLVFTAPDSVSYMNMAANTTQMLAPTSPHPLRQMALYRNRNLSIVVKNIYEKARLGLISTESNDEMKGMDAFTALVSVGSESQEIDVFGGDGFVSETSVVTLNGINVSINFGAKKIMLPFALKLNDFQLERYPGSNSPSSYASEVTVLDESRKLDMPFRIYMNHVLNYRGFRFFQSSYDKDELGTVLSVNHDAAGTIVTYIGYFLMALGMVLTIFSANSRFRSLAKLSAQLRNSRKEMVNILIIAGVFVFTSLPFLATYGQVESSPPPVIDKDHAAKFGKLLVQDKDGRMKPLNTLSSEVLRKIARKTSFNGMNPEQVFLGILVYPDMWQTVPIIKVYNPELEEYLKLDGKYATFNQIVDVHSSEGYRISEYVEKAYAKKPSLQNKFDKEVMKVDERLNIFYMIYSGSFLNVFPIPNDENHKWVTSNEADQFFKGEEALFVKGIFSMYYEEVRKAVESGDWKAADDHLDYIIQFQKKYGAKIHPSEAKINLEIFYNKFDVFKRLSAYYGLIGFVLLVLHFINILKPKINLKKVIRIASILVVILFLMHTAGLAIRWYISGHAPWSNGYESLIYIGWATSLAGLIFVRRSEVTLSVTALLASLILSVAGMSWMDPEITNLVPVLKSYWLIIHVAIITASYGFFALGALLGFFNLVLMNLKSKNNFNRLNLTITELNYITEMTLIIGLFMVTIGTFLGGVWANESWGRYWGWDSKETWALVTVLVYSFVAHMRFIPGFRGNFVYSFAALISFSSVLMTYFGVNYYLSGLHSYAKGDPVPVPTFVYYTLAVVAVVSIMAYITNRRYELLNKPE